MSINERIRMIIHSKNLSPSSFAEIVGVQRANVSHVLSGRNKPSFEFIEKVILSFPNVSAHWLITGKESIVSTNLVQLNDLNQEKSSTNHLDSNTFFDKQPEAENDFKSTMNDVEIEQIVIFYKNGKMKMYTNV